MTADRKEILCKTLLISTSLHQNVMACRFVSAFHWWKKIIRSLITLNIILCFKLETLLFQHKMYLTRLWWSCSHYLINNSTVSLFNVWNTCTILYNELFVNFMIIYTNSAPYNARMDVSSSSNPGEGYPSRACGLWGWTKVTEAQVCIYIFIQIT